MDTCTHPTSVNSPVNELCSALQTVTHTKPLKASSCGGKHSTAPRAPIPLEPGAEGLSKQQIWSSLPNPSPARLSLMLKPLMCSDTTSPSYLLSGARLSRARAGWLVLHKFYSDPSTTQQCSQHSSALTANKWSRTRICLSVTLITTAAVTVNLQSSTSFTFIYNKNIKPSLGVMQFVRKSLN